jgi:hypothetical protein
VRVYLEDGRYSVTDEEGKYHFEDVEPGSHVVQMDTVTVPQTHQLAGCSDHVPQCRPRVLAVRRRSRRRSLAQRLRARSPAGAEGPPRACIWKLPVAGPTQLLHTAKVNAAQLPFSPRA